LPTVIAALRRHHNQNAIFLTNLFFGGRSSGGASR
jgi:Superinfection immunity protein